MAFWELNGGVSQVRLALPLAFALGGCSFTFVESAPDRHEELRYFDCTSTYGLPVADSVFALAQGVSGAVVLAQSEEEFESKNEGGNRNLAAGVNFAGAAVSAASAIYGFVQTRRCEVAKAKLRERLLAAEPVTRSPGEGGGKPQVERLRRPLDPTHPVEESQSGHSTTPHREQTAPAGEHPGTPDPELPERDPEP